ncbi:hypothetical protein GCM10010145_67550 [Streptomyces ruber]|uniref:Signal transduction histidine kinase osmosensitive K+ channel sensor N-terminal domain-containing protein n=2 Tax=Streptomyces TaxID=1883 RepID=A0A918BT01_9ACTN|nr:hypothetical protein GCM10010145_67550 [Streptomyces ruber]
MARGTSRIYLGAAPGVGKTHAMLSEAHRRVERGTDCVVGFVEHHERPRTEVMLRGLEQVGSGGWSTGEPRSGRRTWTRC